MEGCGCIWVVGGDRRQGHLASLLAADGHKVTVVGMEEMEGLVGVTHATSFHGVEGADYVILPLPAMAEGGLMSTPLSARGYQVTDLLDRLNPQQVVCGGRVNHMLRLLAQGRGLVVHDYYQREELAVANGVPTVEGAIQLAMEAMPTTLFGGGALVVGYGRLGKLLSHRLHGLGAKVTVAARSYADLAWISAYGYRPCKLSQLAQEAQGCDVLFNTAPAPLLNAAVLKHLNPQALVVDLASHPGGVDFGVAQELSIQVIWALSLPGKVAPLTAGAILKEVICNLFDELGV